ncbi:restriction endonuclease subunit S [Nitrosomonas sp. sh817]|uniref:restriction endonuclease subunit S n=1 Tax=Nitrosomonas sp. sh817 TaxID=3070658 RepID=UPI0027DDE937|nr:restriction endonuclease subunit S [Nitrosomonas sp. sh817]WMJ07712.1 restriction endonuclease subunit S [Nitrosomonas sp. sh817]
MELKPGYKQTEVGVIPEDWEAVFLDSVTKRGSGHTPDKAHPEYWGGTIKWISLQDSDRLDHGYIYDTAAKITPAGIANSSAKLHPEGTVVLSRDAGVGKSAIMKNEMAVSQHFIAWSCSTSLNNHFLYYWLQSKKSEFERIAMGSTIKTIGLPYFKYLKIPLPIKTEQTAIANALSDADTLIQSLTRLIAKKRQIKQGAMQTLLNPYENGRLKAGWVVKKLGNILRVCHGRSQHEVADKNGKYPILATSGEIGRASKYLYDKPSVLIGRKGTIDVPRYMEYPFWSIDTLFYTEIFEPNNAKYLFYQFNLIDWYSFNEASGVPSLSARTIENIEISLPSPEKQVQIATILSGMDAEITALEAKLEKYRHIKQGMMQNLLTGRIRLI